MVGRYESTYHSIPTGRFRYTIEAIDRKSGISLDEENHIITEPLVMDADKIVSVQTLVANDEPPLESLSAAKDPPERLCSMLSANKVQMMQAASLNSAEDYSKSEIDAVNAVIFSVPCSLKSDIKAQLPKPTMDDPYEAALQAARLGEFSNTKSSSPLSDMTLDGASSRSSEHMALDYLTNRSHICAADSRPHSLEPDTSSTENSSTQCTIEQKSNDIESGSASPSFHRSNPVPSKESNASDHDSARLAASVFDLFSKSYVNIGGKSQSPQREPLCLDVIERQTREVVSNQITQLGESLENEKPDGEVTCLGSRTFSTESCGLENSLLRQSTGLGPPNTPEGPTLIPLPMSPESTISCKTEALQTASPVSCDPQPASLKSLELAKKNLQTRSYTHAGDQLVRPIITTDDTTLDDASSMYSKCEGEYCCLCQYQVGPQVEQPISSKLEKRSTM